MTHFRLGMYFAYDVVSAMVLMPPDTLALAFTVSWLAYLPSQVTYGCAGDTVYMTA